MPGVGGPSGARKSAAAATIGFSGESVLIAISMHAVRLPVEDLPEGSQLAALGRRDRLPCEGPAAPPTDDKHGSPATDSLLFVTQGRSAWPGTADATTRWALG